MNDEEQENPINDIEDIKALMDMGKMGYYIYRGALDEGASIIEAYRVTAAYFRGMFGGSGDSPSEDDS